MTSVVEQLLVSIGRPLVWAGRTTGALAGTAGHTLALILRGRIAWRSVIEQAYLIGNGSLMFITVTLGFLGLISVFQTALQIQQIVPDFTMLGAAFLSMLLREFAPTITGLMIATRVGSGIAAEVGSMTVTEQIDALRMCNADPVEYLIVPRTLACAVMMVTLAVYGAAIAYLCGMICANVAFDVNYRTFLNLQLATVNDVIVGVLKAGAYGIAIPVIAGHAGLTATGGSEGVGWATTT
ncbi:MAG: ABC transporter permease, partial [Myxococcota bacterium]|nr:ABC transporter permease [Myxococcota bacterium]